MNKKMLKKIAAVFAAAATAAAGVPSVMYANASQDWTEQFKDKYTSYPTLCEDYVTHDKYSLTVGYLSDYSSMDQYYYDPDRNIMVNNTRSGMAVKGGEADLICRSDTSSWLVRDNSKYYDLMMYNTARVHDFFESLGYEGYSLMGDRNIYLDVIRESGKGLNDSRSMNGVLRFGVGDGEKYYGLARGYDVVAHEYTHMVTQHKLGWDTYSVDKETGAVMEAYSDIMAELGESDPNWKIGTDVSVQNVKNHNQVKCVRNIADPSLTSSQSIDGDATVYYSNYADYKRAGSSVTFGQGSTVLSHAAYLMYSGTASGYIPKGDLAQLWYTSIDMFKDMPIDPKKATFLDVKTALGKAAEKLFSGRTYVRNKAIINEALAEVGITGNADYRKDTDPTKQISMDTFVAGHSRSYASGTHWQYDHFGSGFTPDENKGEHSCDHRNDVNYCGSVSVSAMAGEGFKKFDYYAEEPYSQCAGFARLMQIEYFGTTKFLRLSRNNVYEPMLGDHLRYDSGSSEHSIFVTKVERKSYDEYLLTYADCNGSGSDCGVEWFKTATLYRDSEGFYFKMSSSKGPSVKGYLQWVERPIHVGDANGDSYVNDLDFAILSNLTYYYDSYNDPSYDIALRDAACDINGDGVIDMKDFDSLRAIRTQRYSNFFKVHGYLK